MRRKAAAGAAAALGVLALAGCDPPPVLQGVADPVDASGPDHSPPDRADLAAQGDIGRGISTGIDGPSRRVVAQGGVILQAQGHDPQGVRSTRLVGRRTAVRCSRPEGVDDLADDAPESVRSENADAGAPQRYASRWTSGGPRRSSDACPAGTRVVFERFEYRAQVENYSGGVAESAPIQVDLSPHGRVDADGDGWGDTDNRRLTLRLTGIESYETEDINEDEVYLVADRRRFPSASVLTPREWDLDPDDDERVDLGGCTGTQRRLSCDVPVAQRVVPAHQAVDGGAVPLVRVELLDDDDDVPCGGEGPACDMWRSDDDLLGSVELPLTWPDGFTHWGTLVRDFERDGADVRLTFRVEAEPVADPEPQLASADGDADGLGEREEAALARDYGGLADPTARDVFVEADVLEPSDQPDATTPVILTSEFARQGLRLHWDLGGRIGGHPGESATVRWPGGGGVLYRAGGHPTLDEVRGRHSPAERARLFHYLLFADEIDGVWGFGRLPPKGDQLAIQTEGPAGIDVAYEYQAITTMHELGHNLGLCHPRRAREECRYELPPPVPHRCIGIDGYTAMGTPEDGAVWDNPCDPVVRGPTYLEEEWREVCPRGIRHSCLPAPAGS